MAHITTVEQIYAAFGRGDVPAILACLAEDVVWEYDSAPNPVPWLQPLRGRDQVPRFFDTLMTQVEFHRFQPKHIVGGGSLVVGVVDFEATVRASAKRVVEVDEVHLFHFDSAGRVARFRHRCDTLLHAQALQKG